MTRLSAVALLSLLSVQGGEAAPGSGHKNVLHIIVDDLRTQLGSYGMGATVSTPNMDRLASEGTQFQRAFVQLAVCSPSRSSFMTGLRPQTLNVFSFARHIRSPLTSYSPVSTLPERLRSRGFTTTSVGKIFHTDLPPNNDGQSWGGPGGFEHYDAPSHWYDESECTDTTLLKSNPMCSVAPADEALLQDTRNVDMALRRVAALGAAYRNSGGDQPFYMAVGLHRPHMRWSVPERFLDRQRGVAEISLATHQIHQQGVTPWAFYNCTALFKRKQVEAYVNISAETGHGNVADPLARTIRRYYYAAVMYADEQVGRLLDGLDRAGLYNTTLVVLHSDHGFKLGEHGSWCKSTNFEADTWIPLIVRAPWIASSRGRVVEDVVELVDLYPSVIELAGLRVASLPDTLEGKSWVPLIDDTIARRPRLQVAFSQYPRCKAVSDQSCAQLENLDFQVMGLSVRSRDFRLTEWYGLYQTENENTDVMWGDPRGSELYDHRNNTGYGERSFEFFDTVNIVDDPQHAGVVAELRDLIRWNWRSRGLCSECKRRGARVKY